MYLPELLIVNLRILIVQQDPQDAGKCGLLAFKDAMTQLLRGAEEILDFAFQDTQEPAGAHTGLFDVPEVLMTDRGPPDYSLVVLWEPRVNIEIWQEIPQVMTQGVGECIYLVKDALAQEGALHADMIYLGEKSVRPADMLVRTIHNVGASCISYNI